MKIKIIVAGSFHAYFVATALIDGGHSVTIITSTPKRFWRKNGFSGKVIYIPLFFQLIRKIFGRRQYSWQKFIDTLFFDLISSLYVQPGDIVYGFAGCSLHSGRKAIKKGGRYILDRACPHFEYQEELLKKEYNKLNEDFYGSGYLRKRQLREEYNLAEIIIVPSKYTADSFSSYPSLVEKIQVISIPPKITFATVKNVSSDHSEQVVVGVIGADLIRKGYFYLLHAWGLLQGSIGQRAKLVIKGPRQQFKKSKVISELMRGLPGVSFGRFYPDLNDFYKQIDILVLSSVDEGFGMVVLEAMANSVPVIVTNNVGASDFVREAQSGIIVEAAKSLPLAQALKMLIEDKDLRETLGNNGGKFMKEKYTALISIRWIY